MEAEVKEAKFNAIIDELSGSSEGLHHICKRHGISHVSFYAWINQNEEWLNKYTRARDIQADYLADQIIEIADDSAHDTIHTENGEMENKEWVNRSKLRVEARKWIASKLKPKKYGEKIDLNATVQNIVIDFKDAE